MDMPRSCCRLSTLNRAFVDAGAPNDQHYTTLGQTMLAQYHWLVDAGLLLAFSVGGLLYYLVFYRSERQNPGLFGEAGPA